MPPPVSEEESSNEDIDEELPKYVKTKPTKKGATVPAKEKAIIVVDEDEEDNEAEDEEVLSGDEFIVEAIKNHIIDEEGVVRFHVKWLGYNKRSDMTWEPEENLQGTASEILNDYYESVGGRDFVLHSGIDEETEKIVKSKKRGRSSAGLSANGKKKRTEKDHPKSGIPPASVAASFKPPSGSWEEDVASIDACEDNDGNVMVFLQWQTGQRTQHPLHVVYQRCPQKMLKFYESHLLFTFSTEVSNSSANVALVFSKGGAGPPKRIA